MAQLSFTNKNTLNKPAGVAQSYHDQMHQMWSQNPSSVDATWRDHFEGADTVLNLLSSLKSGAGGGHDLQAAQGQAGKVMYFVRNFVQNGHLRADLDPLKMKEAYGDTTTALYSTSDESHQATLDFRHYGFTEKDLDEEFYIDMPDWGGLLASKNKWTLRELNEALHTAYCGKIGVEFMHIPERERCKWVRDKIELRQYETVTPEERAHMLDRILWTDEFASFIGTKFNTMKRFGLEGCESMIPGLKAAMDACVAHGADTATIGMPHRGRLSVLANVVRKPLETIFAEFQGTLPSLSEVRGEHESHSGDVKYHLGTSYTKQYPDGKRLTVELLANPSHLECVNPVVMGRVRAENHIRNTKGSKTDRSKIVPFLIHGDASFAG
jgi:2-oxoglutarate dehydrogenase E1 component